MTGHERLQRDPRSNAELLALVRRFSKRFYESDHEFPGFGSAVAVLHARGTRDILAAAVAMTRDPAPHRRSLGCLLLGQLDPKGETLPEESGGALLALLRRERVRQVRADALTALGHSHYRNADAEIVRFVHDRDERVRSSLAFALVGSTSEAAIDALLILMDDEASMEARDWATTAIGMTVSIDGPNIREALLRRASDQDEIVRGEALHGLARRHDHRVIPLLIAELERDDVEHPYLFVAAACEMLFNDEYAKKTAVEVLGLLRVFPPSES